MSASAEVMKMIRLCFGTLFTLMYQAKCSGVTVPKMCETICEALGADVKSRDPGLDAGHIKDGHDKLPRDITETIRKYDPEQAAENVRKTVIPMINPTLQPALVVAVRTVLEGDDSIDDNEPLCWDARIVKKAVVDASSLDIAYVLTALLRYSALLDEDKDARKSIKEIKKNFVNSYKGTVFTILFTLDEPDVLIKWPDGIITRQVHKNAVSDDDIKNDLEELKKLLSKYSKPDEVEVPTKIDSKEMIYVDALYDAYGSAKDIGHKYTRMDVNKDNMFKMNFDEQRYCYYSMEYIRNSLEQALLPIEYRQFDVMKNEVKHGIMPKYYGPYRNGFERLNEVTTQATHVGIHKSLLGFLPGWIGDAEKIGMCHMLVNDKAIQWVHENDGIV